LGRRLLLAAEMPMGGIVMLMLTVLALALTGLAVATYVARNGAELKLGRNALLLLAAMLLPGLIVVLDLLGLLK
jgi:hypothetical protein